MVEIKAGPPIKARPSYFIDKTSVDLPVNKMSDFPSKIRRTSPEDIYPYESFQYPMNACHQLNRPISSPNLLLYRRLHRKEHRPN
jgi:hypothetical protein